MSLVKNLLLGRPDGLRARLKKMLGGGASSSSARPSGGSSPPASGSGAASGWAGAPAAGEKALHLSPEAPKDVTPPEGFEVVLHKDALKPGKVVEIIIGGTAIAVANADGCFHALANTCAHAGGPLGEGSLEGTSLTCPYHGWVYDVSTGDCLTSPGAKVRRYDVVVEKDAVCVKL